MQASLETSNKNVKTRFFQYTLGLILSMEKRSCTNLSKLFDISHDTLYRFLCKHDLFLKFLPHIMIRIAHYFSQIGEGFLILDDTSISKEFSKLIEGVFDVYDSLLGRPKRSLCIVVIAWSNGNITIPIGFNF